MANSINAQLQSMLIMRGTLAYRERRTIIASLLLPVIMVSVAIGISAGIQSTVPSIPPSPLVRRPLLIPEAFGPAQSQLAPGAYGSSYLGLILPSNVPQRDSDIADAAAAEAVASLSRPDVTIVRFASLQEYQNNITSYAKDPENLPMVRAAIVLNPAGIPLGPSSNASIAPRGNPQSFAAEIVTEATQSSMLEPLVHNVVDRIRQALSGQKKTVAFQPSLALFATDGKYTDVSLTIIPSFLSYGFGYMISFFATSKVEEREMGHRDYLFTMGLSPLAYYLSAMIVDIVVFVFNIAATTAILYAFRVSAILSTNYLMWFLPMFFFAPVAAILAQCLAFIFRKQETAGLVLGFGMAIVVFAPYFFVFFYAKNDVAMWIIYTISACVPTFGLYEAFNYIGIAVIDGVPLTVDTLTDFSRNPILGICLIFVAQTAAYSLLLACLVYRDLTNAKSFAAAAYGLISKFNFETNLGINASVDQLITPRVLWEGPSPKPGHADDFEVLREMDHIMDATASDEDIIRIAGVSVEYTKLAPVKRSGFSLMVPKHIERFKVLDDLWLSIRKNECFAYLGPNGCGKTTMIKMLTGMVKPTCGQAQIGPYSILPRYNMHARQVIGICPQHDVVWGKLTPREHLRLISEIRGRSSQLSTMRDEVETLLVDVGLSDFVDTEIGQLSGGNRRKVSLASACLGRPDVVFLDEPTTGVDVAIRRSIWTAIQKIKQRTSVVLTTHSMEEADALSDRIGIMVNGRLQCLGTPQRLKAVYGCGFKVSLRTSGPVDAAREWFLDGMGPQSWIVARHVGSFIVFQMSKTGVEDLRTKLANTANDTEKVIVGTKTLQSIFDFLESSQINTMLSARLGIVSFEVSETTMSEVFVSFATKQRGLEV